MEFLDILKCEIRNVDEDILDMIPKDFPGWLKKTLGESKWDYDAGALNKAIADPVWDLLNRGGKRWRPYLMKLCYEAVFLRDKSVESNGEKNIDKFLPIVEIIHNGTLMIDDVEDSSNLRRGKLCVHKIYGNDIAINAGNAMYYLPMYFLAKSDLEAEMKLKIFELVNEEMVKLHLGQGMDIFWHGGNGIPNEKEYLQMCAFKTGTLARMAAKFGGILGGADKKIILALGEFAESLGVAFQIQDDILNISPGEDWGKDFGDDISEGKRTLLVIRALEVVGVEDARDLIGILNLRTRNKIIISEAIGILKNSGAIEYADRLARELVLNAWKKLDLVLEKSDAKDKLEMFSNYVVEREI